MIDEIYLAKLVEASGGQLFGLTDNRQVATTGLCFMIKSLSSSYQDMIAIHSVRSLKAGKQKKCFDKKLCCFSMRSALTLLQLLLMITLLQIKNFTKNFFVDDVEKAQLKIV